MKRSAPFEVDFEAVKDPRGLRLVMEELERLRKKTPRTDYVPLANKIDGLGLTFPREHPYGELLMALDAIVEGIRTGRGLKEDPATGEPADADLLQEVADRLGELAAGKGIVSFGEDEDGQEED